MDRRALAGARRESVFCCRVSHRLDCVCLWILCLTVARSRAWSTPSRFDPSAPRGPLPPYRSMPKGSERDVLRDEPTWQRNIGAHANSAGPAAAPTAINEQVLDEEDDDDLPTSDDVVRTALCVECRHGRLHVFMPPTQRIEDYLDLISAIEQTVRPARLPCVDRRLPTAPRFSHRNVQGHPRSRRDRSQHAAQRELGSTGGSDRDALRGSKAVPIGDRQNSISMAGTPGPAAAIMSCWAARTRATAPS